MSEKLVTVFGGSGFVGRHLVRRLAKDGYRIRVAVRRPAEGYILYPMGDVGQIAVLKCDIRDQAQVAAAVAPKRARPLVDPAARSLPGLSARRTRRTSH